ARAGALVAIEDPAGRKLGWGLFSAESKIRVRAVARGEVPEPDRAFWRARLARALRARGRLGLLAPERACRLLAGDADGVPGLVVDRYANVAVLQSGTQGSDRLLELIVELLDELAA